MEVTDKYKTFLKFQIARAREYYAEAERGIPMLAPDARLAVRASLDLYSAILDKVEENDYDNFNKRAFTSKWDKLKMLPMTYINSMAKGPMFPFQTVSMASSFHDTAAWSEPSVTVAAAAALVGAAVTATAATLR